MIKMHKLFTATAAAAVITTSVFPGCALAQADQPGISVQEYTVSGSGEIGSGTAVTELGRPVSIQIENTTGGKAYVVRLHEDADGTVTATQLTQATDAAVIPFQSDLFSKYALVAGEGNSIDPSQLNTLYLPDGLTRIEDNAFEGGAFQAVIIPDSCTYVGKEAFLDCENLIYVSYKDGTTEFGEDVFKGCGTVYEDKR